MTLSQVFYILLENCVLHGSKIQQKFVKTVFSSPSPPQRVTDLVSAGRCALQLDAAGNMRNEASQQVDPPVM